MSNFWQHCAISALEISKKHLKCLIFFVKMKLVSTVWVSTSLSKFGYSEMLHISKEWFSNNNSALCMRRLSSLKVGENFVGKIYAENVQVWQISLIDASCLEMLC